MPPLPHSDSLYAGLLPCGLHYPSPPALFSSPFPSGRRHTPVFSSAHGKHSDPTLFPYLHFRKPVYYPPQRLFPYGKNFPVSYLEVLSPCRNLLPAPHFSLSCGNVPPKAPGYIFSFSRKDCKNDPPEFACCLLPLFHCPFPAFFPYPALFPAHFPYRIL